MEQLAECTGGADALIEVMSRDLASGYDVLRIAQRLRADDRDDEALEWARHHGHADLLRQQIDGQAVCGPGAT